LTYCGTSNVPVTCMAQEKALTSACPHCCHQFKVVGLGMQFCFAPSCLHARVMTMAAAATKYHCGALPAASAAPDMRHSRPRRRVACGILCHAPRQCCHAAAAGDSTWGWHQHAARGRGQLQRLPCHCQQPGGIQVSSSLHGPLAMRPCQSVAHAQSVIPKHATQTHTPLTHLATNTTHSLMPHESSQAGGLAGGHTASLPLGCS
jgi:hypothetical protein